MDTHIGAQAQGAWCGRLLGSVLRPKSVQKKVRPRFRKNQTSGFKKIEPSGPKPEAEIGLKIGHEKGPFSTKSIEPLQRSAPWERFRPQFQGPISASEISNFFKKVPTRNPKRTEAKISPRPRPTGPTGGEIYAGMGRVYARRSS